MRGQGGWCEVLPADFHYLSEAGLMKAIKSLGMSLVQPPKFESIKKTVGRTTSPYTFSFFSSLVNQIIAFFCLIVLSLNWMQVPLSN